MERRTLYTLGGLGGTLAILAAVFGHAPEASAKRRVPTDPNEVLEKLATPANDPRSREVAELRKILKADPKNLPAAARLAQVDIQLSRDRSDPRFLGHAQAALEPWWTVADAPEEVLVLRATIEQSLHDFEAALRDLDRAVATRPTDVQAWLVRATVLSVRGRYEEARESCAKVMPLAQRVVGTVCYAQIDGVTGNAKRGIDSLAALGRFSSPEMESWVEGTLGELSLRTGDFEGARAHFDRTLAIDPEDAYVRSAAADLAIDQKRYADAIKLTEGREVNDGLLLRLAIAEDRAKAKDAPIHRDMLAARFDASRLRGDVVHRREESRFELLRGDAPKALELAKANWDVQKEPWDVRVYLEAARAAKAPNDAQPVREWLAKTKLEDPTIAELGK